MLADIKLNVSDETGGTVTLLLEDGRRIVGQFTPRQLEVVENTTLLDVSKAEIAAALALEKHKNDETYVVWHQFVRDVKDIERRHRLHPKYLN